VLRLNLVLEGHDGWINGMTVFDGTLLILTPDPRFELRRFDVETGATLGTIAFLSLVYPRGLQFRPGEGA
jgi:hypothetical protein